MPLPAQTNLSWMRSTVVAMLLLSIVALASCGNNSEEAITVKGAPPITRGEIDAWTARSLASYNYDNRFLAQTLAPLDPPQFRECKAFYQKQQTPSVSQSNISMPINQCRQQYKILRTSVINTLIASRWAHSKINPLRTSNKEKIARETVKLELDSTFPDKSDQSRFLQATRFNLKVLTERRAMDFAASDYFRQSAGNLEQPSLRDLDQVIKKIPDLQKLPVAKARSRASKIWSEAKRKNSSGAYDLSKIRKATRCAEGINTPFCGNRPPAPVGDISGILLAGPLVPKGASPLTSDSKDYEVSPTKGVVKRTPPRDLGPNSPVPYSPYDPTP